MPEAAVIRRATESDIGGIVGLRLAFESITRDSGALAAGTPGETARRAELVALLGRDMRRGKLLCWLAEEGGCAVAQAALRLRVGRDGEILNVYTEPAYRGRGIGTALVATAVAEARALGVRRLSLQPTEDSRGLYKRAGFRAEGRGMKLEVKEPGPSRKDS